MKRLFIAIHVSPEPVLLNLLEMLKTELSNERINWVKPANMHLTLKFLGSVAEAQIPVINDAVRECISGFEPLALQFDKTGIFGSRYEPRVLWLGPDKISPQLHSLANNLLDAMDTLGFIRDRQNFVPHLTLGRIKKLTDKQHFQQVIGNIPQKTYIQTRVDELILFESILHKEGPQYLVQQAFSLSKQGV
ncbi:MAG: RNA 2',3'-cyclic phosphodiesterase [Bacteroidetes bacterium]|nr:RNA 2',3'-cyclic phosphodiesterase [Bacteroidota bacterium]MBU1578454.1 RNA 2',3'-cyclic phosphodiesterase [Bacteroidota bacterium]MBU2465344.1 RNA 2',3'-cyclic phosphodiesterase [Bacteroidota bacterium]MBU2557399.1 RNA 2',3'-cyclic phosphodiesterase [Bacteroidota bacterium]